MKPIEKILIAFLVLFTVGLGLCYYMLFTREQYYNKDFEDWKKQQIKQFNELMERFQKIENRTLELEKKFALEEKIERYIIVSRYYDHAKPLELKTVQQVSCLVVGLSYKYPEVTLGEILSHIRKESEFYPLAVGTHGEFGLNQVTHETFKLFGEGHFYNYKNAAEAGIRYYIYLKMILNNDHDWVIAAYNTGPNISRKTALKLACQYVKDVKKYQKEILEFI